MKTAADKYKSKYGIFAAQGFEKGVKYAQKWYDVGNTNMISEDEVLLLKLKDGSIYTGYWNNTTGLFESNNEPYSTIHNVILWRPIDVK